MFALISTCDVSAAEIARATTSGAIAVANLDHQLAQAGAPDQKIELLLMRSRFLGDYGALDRAMELAESLPANGEYLLLRARVRAAAHKFKEALHDMEAARGMGIGADRVSAQESSILIATGRAAEVLPRLEADARRSPGFISSSTLATAYAELGRYDEAANAFDAALEDLRTTSPFPYAWLHFARGLMWSEQAGDTERGEIEYLQALIYLPEYAIANVHQAELELRRGDVKTAGARVTRVAEATADPQALAVLAEVRQRTGDRAGAKRAIHAAARRFGTLLVTQPLAFADHAAEFYLGPGAEPERAWRLARCNLENRATRGALTLAIRAAAASGHPMGNGATPGVPRRATCS